MSRSMVLAEVVSINRFVCGGTANSTFTHFCHSFNNRLFLYRLYIETMSDSEQYAMENADAGASETIPMEAGQIKKGG